MKLTTTLTAFVLIGVASSAQAAGEPSAATARVSYRDLNLTTAAGSQALYRRIVSAARKVCAPEDIRVLNEVMIAHACESAAVERAVREAHSSQLAAVHAAQPPQG
ncbi:MAG TPA: UrcA family protein [Candidatus Dormibacteraeota bacterium]|nr:UrcA family protein [Candidatus Dormibacteraeota bacterium]